MNNTLFKQPNISNKTLSILLGVLILISIGMLVWSLDKVKENVTEETNTSLTKTEEQKKEDIMEVDTSDWLTYRNEEYGFEFRYPRGWEVLPPSNTTREPKNIINLSPIEREYAQARDVQLNYFNKQLNGLPIETFFLNYFGDIQNCHGGICSLFNDIQPNLVYKNNDITFYNFQRVGDVITGRHTILVSGNNVFQFYTPINEVIQFEPRMDELFTKIINTMKRV